MFLNVFSKQLKIGFRNKQNIFWTLMFPVILGTLFYVAFGSLFKSFVSEPIKTAVVSESSNKELENTIVDFLASIEMKDMKILDIVDPTDDPDKLLKDEKVNGIIYIEENGRLRLKAKSNGNQTTIQESIITAYNQSADLVERVAAEHPERLEEVLKSISSRVDYINAKDMAGENKDPYLSYFYNLIAMTALFASLNSLRIGNNCQANMSSLGARTNASPLRRVMFQLAGFLAAFIVQTFVLCIGLSYLIFILKIKIIGCHINILKIFGLVLFMHLVLHIEIQFTAQAVPCFGKTDRIMFTGESCKHIRSIWLCFTCSIVINSVTMGKPVTFLAFIKYSIPIVSVSFIQ